MSRHTNTEQLGINAVNNIVYEEMDWIYRPVPPPDVGIDGTIEQKLNGEPTAKFLAVQLKTGLSHFNHDKKKNRLTYRASLIHYNYWLSSNIPVLLVAYIPEWKKSYWQLIDKSKFKKLSKSWQLDIPLKNILGKSSIKDFNQILLKKTKTETITERSFYDYIEDSFLIGGANTRTAAITELLKLTTNKAAELTNFLKEFNQDGSNFNRLELDAKLSSSGRYFNQISREFLVQIEIFAECYALGISALTKLIKLNYDVNGEYDNIEETHVSVKGLAKSILAALQSMQGFYETLKNMEKLNNKTYDDGIETLRLSVGQIVVEFEIAHKMAEELELELSEL